MPGKKTRPPNPPALTKPSVFLVLYLSAVPNTQTREGHNLLTTKLYKINLQTPPCTSEAYQTDTMVSTTSKIFSPFVCIHYGKRTERDQSRVNFEVNTPAEFPFHLENFFENLTQTQTQNANNTHSDQNSTPATASSAICFTHDLVNALTIFHEIKNPKAEFLIQNVSLSVIKDKSNLLMKSYKVPSMESLNMFFRKRCTTLRRRAKAMAG